jgi:uncharacterized protein YndB with AHSA1/START domain
VTLTIAPVRKEVVVNTSAQRAFDVFTKHLATWWPCDTHKLGAGEVETVVMEPHEGGRLYERGIDASECIWGHVRVWDPPARVVFTWEISAEWQPDSSMDSEVEVRFVAETASRTRVELEHRKLEAFGDRAPEMREAFDGEGAWSGLLVKFADAANA